MSKIEDSDGEELSCSCFSNEDQKVLQETILGTRSNYPEDPQAQIRLMQQNLKHFEKKVFPEIKQDLSSVKWAEKLFAGVPRGVSPPPFAVKLGETQAGLIVWYDPLNDVLLLNDGEKLEVCSEDLVIHRLQFLTKPTQNV